ncbi:MAG TPA: hypothetical protein VE422_30765 [Terriglobia bacterium]|nr:hypothetical protein [Terriglobia bacterium]
MFMAEEQPNVVFEYSDEQAIEDGVLVAVSEGKVNRVTRTVFDHFTKSATEPAGTESEIDIEPLREVIHAILQVPPDEDGWRKLTYREKELWLLPNEIGGLTLMLPDDY